jgi:plastocyanin
MIYIAVYLPAFLLKAMKRVLFLLVCSWVNLLISGVTPAETSDLPEPYRTTLDKDGIQRVQILGGDYFFKPKHIIVKARVPVQLSVSVEPGIKPHDIVIKAPQAGIWVNQKLATAPKTLSFTPLMPGKYSFYCSSKLLFFESHRERGMQGVLEVTE